MYVPECVPQSNLSSAQLERNKTKEQLEEEKRISLSIRIKPLTIDGLSVDKLRDKARELWDCIVKLETEKYDLEERQKRQDYDVSSIHIYEYVMYYTYPLSFSMYAYSWKSWRKDRSNNSGTRLRRRVWTLKPLPANIQ